ncbi:hypothetical protein [Sphingomonas mesophila]|uniref:hypothetical protein n=1 Tax=Sphingomonas mesophila TaxID=2303576 RepID=UPI000E5779FA|nr:hypothetical protein [Sphingomonas mesophila]
MSRPTVFIQANARQMLGARISAESFKRASRNPDSFDVVIMDAADYPRLMAPGQSILRAGHIRAWDPDDLQSFTPLRFAPPKLMNYSGKAVVVDPDCFGVGDVAELFARDMAGKAVMAVPRPGHNKRNDYIATSVMLLDCAKLTHWDPDKDQDDLFAQRFDYIDWIELKREDPATVGFLEPEWNHFDTLKPETRILHTTKRRTQPWKTGLPVDFTLRERGPLDFLRRLKRRRYEPHPDPNQEALVYAILADLVDKGSLSKNELVAEMAANHIRHDSLDLIERYRGWNGLPAAA